MSDVTEEGRIKIQKGQYEVLQSKNMCLPKGLLKTIMTIMAIASVAGGVAVMVFGGIGLNSGAYQYLEEKWVLMLFIYGFGSFLIIVGILQFCACKSENRCAIFSYEIFAIVTFLLFAGFLVGVWVFKSQFVDMIEKAAQEENNDFGRMFRGVEKYHDRIFNDLCKGAINVQQCSAADKKEIYGERMPNEMFFHLGALIEGTVKCSGLTKKLDKFYFTNKNNPKPPVGPCEPLLVDFINKNFGSWGYVAGISIVVLLFLFLDVIAGYCICCHPEREDAKTYGAPYAPM